MYSKSPQAKTDQPTRLDFVINLFFVHTGYVPDSDEFADYARTVSTTCWIEGVYVYRSLATTNLDQTSYYGITKDIDLDGRLSGGKELCKTFDRMTHKFNEECEPMDKTFFIQVIIIYHACFPRKARLAIFTTDLYN